jgi:hypothetical protein
MGQREKVAWFGEEHNEREPPAGRLGKKLDLKRAKQDVSPGSEILIDFDRFPGMIPLPYASHNLCLG